MKSKRPQCCSLSAAPKALTASGGCWLLSKDIFQRVTWKLPQPGSVTNNRSLSNSGHCPAGGWRNRRGFTVPFPPMQSAPGHRKHTVMPKLGCGVGELPLSEISTERHPAHHRVTGIRSYLSLVSPAEQFAYQLLRMSGGHSRNCEACRAGLLPSEPHVLLPGLLGHQWQQGWGAALAHLSFWWGLLCSSWGTMMLLWGRLCPKLFSKGVFGNGFMLQGFFLYPLLPLSGPIHPLLATINKVSLPPAVRAGFAACF